MNLMIYSRFFPTTVLFFLIFFPLYTETQNNACYVNLDKKVSNIAQIISQISNLDDDSNSPLHELKEFIERGFSVVEYDDIIETLEYAEIILQNNYKKLDDTAAEHIAKDLDIIITQVIDGILTIDLEDFEQDPDSIIFRSPTKKIYGNLYVSGKTTLKKHVHTKQGIHAHGKLRIGKTSLFEGDATFEEDVIVQGILSSSDASINNLSITNLTVDDCVDDLCVTNLSVDSADIQNLTLTGALSFTDISVVDQTISGTLSVTDEVINGNLKIPSFTPAGVVHNNASGLLSCSLIVNADVSASAAIVDTKLATISTAGKVANSATTATSTDTANTIVLRNALGNFATNMITLNGAVINPTDAATKAYVDAAIPGGAVTGANVGAGTGLIFRDKTGNDINFKTLINGAHFDLTNNANDITLATDATSANTAGTIIARDGSGNFAAGTITANLSGNATTATSATTAINFSGSLAGDVTGTQGATVVSTVGGQTAANVAVATVLANAATSTNTANAIMKRDALGNFATNMITLDGTVTNPTDATTKAYVDAAVIPGTGTNLNLPNTIVQRDGTGSFAAQVVSVVDSVASGNLVLSTNPSTSTAGNILKGSSRFIHNFGTNNTFVGVNAGSFGTSGSGANNAFGVSALTSITTGSNNIAIGYQAGQTLTNGSGNIYINADAAISSENSTMRIGTLQTSCFIAGIYTSGVSGDGVVVDSNGKLGITLSSERFKHDIQDMDGDSTNIMKLRPVTFAYNNDENNIKQYGLIAEEVEKIFPAIVVKDENGLPYTVRYHLLPVMLLNELQKQQATIEEMKNAIDYLRTEIQKLMAKKN